MLRSIRVVKVGGHEVDDAGWIALLARALQSSSEPTVLVHGGGKEISELQHTLGATPEWRGGLRVTTPEALRAAAMVLSGVVNKRLVSGLLSAGADAVGISGEDSSLLLAEPAEGGALGRTGTIVSVRPGILDTLLQAGHLPVVSPVSRGTDAKPLNVNADDAAAALALALGARRFQMISNVPGLLIDGAVASRIDVSDVDHLISSGVASGGMGPKIRAAARAAEGGVPEVWIGGLDLITSGSGGTRVTSRLPLAASA
ncbi:acetylglutamate kinase [soil metagenome]